MTTAGNDPLSQPPALRSRGLLTRIAAPFQPKSRSVLDLHVVLDDPHREYTLGETIKGNVKFTALRPFRVTHVVVQLRGFVKVYKNPTPPGEGLSSEVAAVSTLSGRKGSKNGPGFASLYEDEKVICGSGNLGIAAYEIPFTFVLPEEPMPSSLDFERGTIMYFLNAIITRPTTVAPTITAQQRIQIIERIDIGTMVTSKRLAVSMKAVSRRTKSRNAVREDRDRASTLASRSTTLTLSDMDNSRDRQSISEQSAISAGSGNSGGTPGAGLSFETTEVEIGATPPAKRTASATIDIMREGYLPGDLVPIRVTVKHHKLLNAMKGVIVTLYRRAKIDLLPETGSTKDDSKYDPTKIRGLSDFFTATSVMSRTFRYDLDQNLEDLIINPSTMQAEVKTAVRIPDDAFPSITCVPMGLMTFTYHVEVIMDLMGKLSSLDRLLPRLGMTHTHTGYGFDLAARGSAAHVTSSSDGRFLDTASIRRVDAIAQCTFSIVVGTKDSARKTHKRTFDPWTEAQKLYGIPDAPQTPAVERGLEDLRIVPSSAPVANNIEQVVRWQQPPNGPMPIQPPESEPMPTDEKSRLRRAEELLLPSHPPEDGPSGSRSTPAPAPSAPGLSTIDEQSPAYHLPAVPLPVQDQQHVGEKERMRRHEAALLPGAPDDAETAAGPSASAPTLDSVEGGIYSRYSDLTVVPSAPTYGNVTDDAGPSTAAPPYAAGQSSAAGPSSSPALAMPVSEDKQELERRRLQAEASAPDLEEEEGGEEADEEAAVPTAPVFDESGVSEQQHWEHVEGSSDLPQYRR